MDTDKKFYYIRCKENKPWLTICVIKAPTDKDAGMMVHYSRGVAICSPLDSPNKKIGRAIAEGRAIKSLTAKKSSDNINRPELKEIFFNENIDKAILPWANIRCKAEYMPRLNQYEIDLFAPPEYKNAVKTQKL